MSSPTLRQKLVLIMVTLSFVLLSLLLILYYQAEKAFYSNLEDQISDLSSAIQVGVEEVTGASDEKRLTAYLSRLKSKGIKEVSIISNTEEIVASTNPEKIGSPIGPVKKDMIIRAELGRPVTAEGRTYNVIIPVIVGDAHYGYLHLKINTEDFSKVLRSNLYKRIAVTLAIFSIGIVFSLFLSAQYTRPIQEIITAVRSIMAGNFNYSFSLNASGEIEELSKNIKKMAKVLENEKILQENLRKAEHLALIGQFAREVAHEVRNPLNFINLSIDHIKQKLSSIENFQKEVHLLETVKKEIHRLDNLVSNFLEYAKPLTVKRQPLESAILFEDIIELVKSKAESAGIIIRTEFEMLPAIEGDPDLLKTSIMNIINNSIQAMPDGGELCIKTWTQDKRFFIEIRDSGYGIDKKNLEKVFEPFFTTKPKGLGLGLSTARRIIEEHGGQISIKSAPGKGTSVIIEIPLRDTVPQSF